MSASIFERELKGILSGDETMVRKVSRTSPADVHFAYLKILEKPFIVIRAAGSFGVDLVAIRGDFSFPIEVKASSYKTIRFSESSGRASKQAEELMAECRRASVFPIYAFRLKGVRGNDAWRIFTVDMGEDNVEGIARMVYNILPKVHITKAGNIALKFEEGMPLHKFIDYLC